MAYFPVAIWDGDSENRDSNSGNRSGPDHRDWTQMMSEIIAMQDYTLNHDIDLGTRSINFGPTPEASLSYVNSVITWNLAESGANSLRVGDGTNYFQINSTGETLLAGTAKRKISVTPEVDYIAQIAQAKPTQVTIGVFHGFSFPIYNNDNEELFYNVRVPYEWDGVSDPEICLTVALSGAEDLGDTFKFRVSWERFSHDDTIPATVHDVDVEQAILTDHTAQYSVYHIHFHIDYDISDVLLHGDTFSYRLRRITSSGTEVDNEILVFDSVVDFQINTFAATWERD
jgi:hypothetical protein